MTIGDGHGGWAEPIIGVKLSNLTAANWGFYKVLYRPVGGEDIIVLGATILIDRATYPSGDFVLFDSVNLRGGGILR
jgi:hypothetical protein